MSLLDMLDVFSKTESASRRISLNLAPASPATISSPCLVLPLYQDRFPGKYPDLLIAAILTRFQLLIFLRFSSTQKDLCHVIQVLPKQSLKIPKNQSQ